MLLQLQLHLFVGTLLCKIHVYTNLLEENKDRGLADFYSESKDYALDDNSHFGDMSEDDLFREMFPQKIPTRNDYNIYGDPDIETFIIINMSSFIG